MNDLEIILSIVVVLLIFLNILQIEINNNFNKRFKIMADWLVNHDVQHKMFADWVDSATPLIAAKEPREQNSNTPNTKAPKTEARTC